jgi:FkbM family methyltransferase
VGAAPGCLTLHVSPRTPTVTSGSPRFLAEATRVPGFAWVDWSQQIKVPVTTLDRLIKAHGLPAFVKIDVDGMEHEVLAGLSVPLSALSFESCPRARTLRWRAWFGWRTLAATATI